MADSYNETIVTLNSNNEKHQQSYSVPSDNNISDPPPPYREVFSPSGGFSDSQTVNLLNPQPTTSNVADKIIYVQKEGGNFGQVSYLMTDARNKKLFEANVRFSRCDANSAYTYTSFFDSVEHMSICRVDNNTAGARKVMQILSESQKVLGVITVMKQPDAEGNIVRIHNEAGVELFRYKLIVTEAMLGEQNLAKEFAYEVFTSTGEVVAKLVHYKNNCNDGKRYKFSYSLPLDKPTLTVILTGVFGIEEDVIGKATNRFYQLLVIGLCFLLFIFITVMFI